MLEVIIGFLIVAMLLFDIFQAVLVPRFTPPSLRLGPLLIGRIAWPICRKIATFIHNEAALDFYLGSFAPMAFVLIFTGWLSSMTFAFALIIHGLGNQFHPAIDSFSSAIYLAGTALLTLGFGDIIGVSSLGRLVLLLSGATGITIVAVGVSFLFSMQQSVHNREVTVNAFQSRITSSASAVQLLVRYADLGITEQLADQLHTWELWAADVLASHRAFPLLCYFRSGRMCVSWITVLGIMLDASNLLSTTVNDKRFGHSVFFLQIGSQLGKFFKDYLRIDSTSPCITREEFIAAYACLQEHGYDLYDEELAWERFRITRSQYAPAIRALAFMFVSQTPGWMQGEAKHILRARSKQELIKSR